MFQPVKKYPSNPGGVYCTLEMLEAASEFTIILFGGKLWYVADLDTGDGLHAVTLIHRLELGMN